MTSMSRTPEPLVGNYLTYFYEGGPIPESALIGLERGYDRARQDFGLRMVPWSPVAGREEGSVARDIMLPLALDPHEARSSRRPCAECSTWSTPER